MAHKCSEAIGEGTPLNLIEIKTPVSLFLGERVSPVGSCEAPGLEEEGRSREGG